MTQKWPTDRKMITILNAMLRENVAWQPKPA
jgi:hypothetical protein